jgi:hypothetical protein
LVDEYRETEKSWCPRVFDHTEAKPSIGAAQPWTTLIDGVPEEAGEAPSEGGVEPRIDDGPEAIEAKLPAGAQQEVSDIVTKAVILDAGGAARL